MALLLVPTHGFANGRFPLAQRLLVDVRDEQRLYLTATFGLLLSADRGAHWYHVCEKAFALEELEGDALLELTADGAILSGIRGSLNNSADCGCSWQPVTASLDTDTIVDVARSSAGLVALVRSAGPSTTFRLQKSSDGTAWQDVSELPGPLFEALTVDVAAADPAQIYVSAMNKSGQGALLVSGDGGAKWQTLPITGADTSNQPYIAAIDPQDPKRVFLRTNGWATNADGLEQADDALLLSDDAGGTWREVIRRRAKLFGFALAPDGSTVLAGYGDPIQATRVVVPEDVGLYRASTSDFTFSRVLPEAINCLTWTSAGLFACFQEKGVDAIAPFSLGFMPSPELDAASISRFEPVLRLKDVRGPLGCTASMCLPAWQTGSADSPAVCARLGAACDVDPAANALACGTPEGGTGGSGGTANAHDLAGRSGAGAGVGGASAAGSPASNPTAGSVSGGAASGASARERDSSCSCQLPGMGASYEALPGALSALALLGLRRRHN